MHQKREADADHRDGRVRQGDTWRQVRRVLRCEQLSDHGDPRGRGVRGRRCVGPRRGAKLAHMRNVQLASPATFDYWRASVWWLESAGFRSGTGKRDADAVGRRELVRFLGSIASGIAASVRHEDDRRRVLTKLGELADTLVDPLQIEKNDASGAARTADEASRP